MTLVYLEIDAKSISRDEVLESLPDLGSAELPSHGTHADMTTTLVGRLPAGTSVDEGQALTLAVNPHRIEFFDLESRRAID
jgi:hypothetical protein